MQLHAAPFIQSATPVDIVPWWLSKAQLKRVPFFSLPWNMDPFILELYNIVCLPFSSYFLSVFLLHFNHCSIAPSAFCQLF
jgi:hypothetical protein